MITNISMLQLYRKKGQGFQWKMGQNRGQPSATFEAIKQAIYLHKANI